MNESDLRSDVHYLGSSENKAWKKNSGLYGIWTHDLIGGGYPVGRSEIHRVTEICSAQNDGLIRKSSYFMKLFISHLV